MLDRAEVFVPNRIGSGERGRRAAIYKVGDLELASRLSFFLWSSIPDDELLELAAQGKAQGSRGSRRSRSSACSPIPNRKRWSATSPASGLFLRNLQSAKPDGHEFPNFDDNLRQAFRRETELLFESIMRENRSVVDLLTANYTFVNERLARHYGIPNVYGSQFRRVTLTDQTRIGLLGQGSVLTVTSYPNRTSPVLRGKWILENILGTPPPPPPPNVPPLKENEEGLETEIGPRTDGRASEESGLRELPCGDGSAGILARELRWTRRMANERSSGPDRCIRSAGGRNESEGPVSLREALMKHPEQFVGTVTEKMLTYALGRGLEYYDMPVVRGIVQDAAKNDYKIYVADHGYREEHTVSDEEVATER